MYRDADDVTRLVELTIGASWDNAEAADRQAVVDRVRAAARASGSTEG